MPICIVLVPDVLGLGPVVPPVVEITVGHDVDGVEGGDGEPVVEGGVIVLSREILSGHGCGLEVIVKIDAEEVGITQDGGRKGALFIVQQNRPLHTRDGPVQEGGGELQDPDGCHPEGAGITQLEVDRTPAGDRCVHLDLSIEIDPHMIVIRVHQDSEGELLPVVDVRVLDLDGTPEGGPTFNLAARVQGEQGVILLFREIAHI